LDWMKLILVHHCQVTKPAGEWVWCRVVVQGKSFSRQVIIILEDWYDFSSKLPIRGNGYGPTWQSLYSP
jgi:hypothetical protein